MLKCTTTPDKSRVHVIVDEEKVDWKYIRKGYKIMVYLKHDISSDYRAIPL